jgi:hypothetical protein
MKGFLTITYKSPENDIKGIRIQDNISSENEPEKSIFSDARGGIKFASLAEYMDDKLSKELAGHSRCCMTSFKKPSKNPVYIKNAQALYDATPNEALKIQENRKKFEEMFKPLLDDTVMVTTDGVTGIYYAILHPTMLWLYEDKDVRHHSSSFILLGCH